MTDTLVGSLVTFKRISANNGEALFNRVNPSIFCELAGFTEPLQLERLKFRLQEGTLKMWDIVDNRSKKVLGYGGLVYYLGAPFPFAYVNDTVFYKLEPELRQDIFKLFPKAHFPQNTNRLHVFVPLPIDEDLTFELDGLGFDFGDEDSERQAYSISLETFQMYYGS